MPSRPIVAAKSASVSGGKHKKEKAKTDASVFALESGRGERIRTSDSYVPNVVLYQAELHPEIRSVAPFGRFSDLSELIRI